jgi:mercuric ion transport protein
MSRTTLWAGAGGVSAAFLASLCCMGPLLFVTLGVGAGLATTFEPLRPVFDVVMVALFGLAFYSVYGRRPERVAVASSGPGTRGQSVGTGATDAVCGVPRDRRRDKVVLWLAAVLALVLWSFPTWSKWLV